MTIERQTQINTLYRAALERPTAEREAFVAEHSGSDDELRRAVESLLARNDTTIREPNGGIATGTVFGTYRIDGLLAQGGMGIVCRATDTKLNRTVAVKFLSDDLLDANARRRFQREAQMASALNHPHILTVHDAGNHDGRDYLVTEFVDGGTLVDWMETQGLRSWRQSVELLIGVADGIAAAHAANILHRDIKPANILISKSGYAKLADFGLAKLGDGPPHRAPGQYTVAGAVIGTIGYMSPEQAAGRALDARSDIFSFGVVLYELLTGRRPFTGATDLELLQSVIHAPAAPLGNDIPEPLRRIVEKAIEKDPAERYQTMRDLVVDLRHVAHRTAEHPEPRAAAVTAWRRRPAVMIALSIVALAAVAAIWSWQRADETASTSKSADTAPAPAATPAEQPSLAVLPFDDLSQARDQEYLGDGLAEEILNQLAQVPALRLVGRASSFSFKGKNEDLRTIGGKLGVAHLLAGSVRKDGDRLRINAQLIRADDGTHLWSKTYARDLRDVFAVQDEIAHDVAQALSVKLDVVTLNRAQGGTSNIDAYDRYLRWRQVLFSDNNDVEHVRQRVQLAREAVALDPGFVLAWAALADSLQTLAYVGDETQAAQLRAEAAQVRARIAQQAPDNWTVKRERAYGLWGEGKRAEAIDVAREIMENGPLTYEHAFPYINMIFAAGHLDEGVALAEQLRAIEPLTMFISRDLQFDYIAARRYEEAETEYRRSLTLEGNHDEPTYLAFTRMLARKDADPKALLERYRQWLPDEVLPDPPPFLRDLGAVLHDRDAMLAILRKSLADPAYGGGREGVQLHIADALGETDLAVAALRKLMENQEGFREGRMDYRAYWQLWLAPYSGLRAHPEFKKLLREIDLVDYWRQTSKWGDGCKPVGTDDFQCQ